MSLFLGKNGLLLFKKILEHFRDYGISSFKPILFLKKMAGGQDISMSESSESKLDTIINALTILSQRIAEIKGAFAKMHNDGAFGVAQSMIY